MNNNYNKYFTETENGLDIEANNINVNCITSQNNKFSLDNEGNLTVNSIVTNNQSGNLNFDSIYPVGSIYMSVSDTNPSTLFSGTTWEKIMDRFLIGAGNEYILGSIGGEKTHTLSIAEMPAHTHYPSSYGANFVPAKNLGRGRCAQSSTGTNYVLAGDSYDDYVWSGTSSTGGSKAHNNIPPYLAVNIWKRVS